MKILFSDSTEETQPTNYKGMAELLCKLLQNRRGESMVEVIAAGIVFILLLETFCAGIKFASGALTESQAVRDNIVQYQQSILQNLEDGEIYNSSAGFISFDGGSFTVPVKFQTVEASDVRKASRSISGKSQANQGKIPVFYLFAAQDAPVE